MGIRQSTARYESWLAERIPLVAADLELKHTSMRESVFSFLRATFYRWTETVTPIAADAIGGPRVLSVGDLHLENFGTWRDAEGRLVWGVNDFDEACELPATSDLVRLATSAALAFAEKKLSIDAKTAAEALLEGYRGALEAGGHPIVLAESNGKLRAMAIRALKDPEAFWAKLDKLAPFDGELPQPAAAALAAALPTEASPWRVSHRVAGLGSLGRQRFVAVVTWRGAKVAREAKPLVASACVWSGQCPAEPEHPYAKMIARSTRCPDPCVRVMGGWIVRRLGPDCTKIDISALPKERDEERLLTAMGWETANVHLETADASALAADLGGRRKAWLSSAAEKMASSVNDDWQSFRKG